MMRSIAIAVVTTFMLSCNDAETKTEATNNDSAKAIADSATQSLQKTAETVVDSAADKMERVVDKVKAKTNDLLKDSVKK